MKEYLYDEESVRALVEWARSTVFPQSLCLTEYENIFNVPQYVETNLYDIEDHYPNPIYNSSITRLYRLKEALEQPSDDVTA